MFIIYDKMVLLYAVCYYLLLVKTLTLLSSFTQVYQHSSTHLIIPQVLSSEKFLAACAAGQSPLSVYWWWWMSENNSSLHSPKTDRRTLFSLSFDQESGLWLQTMCWTALRMVPGLQKDPMKFPFPHVPHLPFTLSGIGGRRWPAGG